MRVARGLEPHPLSHFRPMVGAGARGMVGRAFDVGPQDDAFVALRDEVLQRYEARMTRQTHGFPDMLPVPAALQANSLPWGIVTNKAPRFSEPLVRSMNSLSKVSA